MDQHYHLICVHPFDKFTKGQMITDAEEVKKHLDDREHHFIRITVPGVEHDDNESVAAAPSTTVTPKAK